MARINITTNDGELLEQIDLDEYDLRRSIARDAIMDEIVRNVRASGEGRTSDISSVAIGRIDPRKYSIVGVNGMKDRVVIAHRNTSDEAEAYVGSGGGFISSYTDVEIIPPAVPQ